MPREIAETFLHPSNQLMTPDFTSWGIKEKGWLAKTLASSICGLAIGDITYEEHGKDMLRLVEAAKQNLGINGKLTRGPKGTYGVLNAALVEYFSRE